MSCVYLHHTPAHSNLHLYRMQPQDYGTFLALPYPKSAKILCFIFHRINQKLKKVLKNWYLSGVLRHKSSVNSKRVKLWSHFKVLTCNVTSLSSTWISFVTKSAPIVALYCRLNFLYTYLNSKLMFHKVMI